MIMTRIHDDRDRASATIMSHRYGLRVTARDYILAAVPSGAAQEARYPAV